MFGWFRRDADLSLAFETTDLFGITGEELLKYLDRHCAVQAGIVRQVNVAYGAAPQERGDPVSPKRTAGQRSRATVACGLRLVVVVPVIK